MYYYYTYNLNIYIILFKYNDNNNNSHAYINMISLISKMIRFPRKIIRGAAEG